MHNYSIDSDIRKKVDRYITVLAIVLMFLFAIILKCLGIDFIPLEISKSTIVELASKLFTTAVTISVIINILFDKLLWKCKVFKRIHNIPNLNGGWSGKYISSYTNDIGENVKGMTEINIKQTWSKIKIESYGDKSESHSIIAGLLFNGTNGIELRYEYFNKSNKHVIKTMNKHYGLNALTYNETLDKLQGEYYTDKDRCTYGTIEVIRKKE